MDGNEKNPFASKEYFFLCWLADHQSTIAGKNMVRFSQKELAVEYGSCETTVNRWIAMLRRFGCIEPIKKGSYYVTPTGLNVITRMKEIEKILGGKQYAD